jgi:glycosidase
MPWDDTPGAGFTDASATPWLPFGGDVADRNVAAQRADRGSVLHLVRDLIALRRATPDLVGGTYEPLAVTDGAWAWRRGERHAVALNLGADTVAVDGLAGRMAIVTDRARDGERCDGALRLGPYEGAVLELDP